MTTTLGTRLGTRLGTLLDAFAPAAPPITPGVPAGALFAVSGFSAADYYASQAGGGEAGVASGFGIAVLVRFRPAATSAFRVLFDRFVGATGYSLYTSGTNSLLWAEAKAAGGASSTTSITLSPSDYGRLMVVVLQHTGAAIRLMLYRAPGTDVSISGFAPASTTTVLGARGAGTIPNDATDTAAALTFTGTPSLAQLQAFYDAARMLGDLPATIAGATVTHRWSAREQLAGQVVVDGQQAPAQLDDTVTRASVDALARVGTAAKVRVVDPSLDGRRAYGVLGFSAASRLQTDAGKGLRGGTSSWGMWHGRIDASGGLAALAACTLIGAGGWQAYVNVSNGQITYTSDSPNNGGYPFQVQTATGVISAGDIGTMQTVAWSYDGANLRLYYKGLQVASVAATGFITSAASVPMTFGTRGDASIIGTNLSHCGLQGSDAAVPSAAEILAAHEATIASGQLVAIAGKTQHQHTVTLDVLANGGPTQGVPAQIVDRIGTDHLARVGTGLQVAQRVERVWSYESTPILYGAKGWTTTDFYAAAGAAGFDGVVSGFMVEVLFMVPTQGASLAARTLVSKRNPAADLTGWHISVGGTSSSISFGIGTAGSSTSSPNATITAGDVGKILTYTGVWDNANGRVRGYYKRAEAGIGSGWSSGTYAPCTTEPLRFGLRGDGWPATDLVIFGFRAGRFVPTAAEIQAASDRLLADETLTSVYPGRTLDCLYRFPAGATPAEVDELMSGGAALIKQGAALTSHAQYARAWAI